MSSWNWSGKLLASALLLGAMQARSADGGAKQGSDPAHRVSPYSRYAHEHAQSTAIKNGRVKVKHSRTSSSQGRR